MEEEICHKRQVTLDLDIMATIAPCAPNTSNSQGHQSHYLHVVDLYWHVKLLLGNFLVGKIQSQVNVLHRLDELKDLMFGVER